MDPNSFGDEKSESRLYVGNLDLKITEAALIKMFSPYGKIVAEDFLWHTRGPRRGSHEAMLLSSLAPKRKLNWRKRRCMGDLLVAALWLFVWLAKYMEEFAQSNSARSAREVSKTGLIGNSSGR